MEENKKYKVTNRSIGLVCYKIPDLNIARRIHPNESIIVTREELEKLAFRPGGKTLIYNYLFIQDAEAIKSLGMKVENEYFLSVEEVIELLKNGSIEQFKDTLDYAPKGILDIIKDQAVKLPLNDYAKREAIRAKTGFDVSAALVKNSDNETEVEHVQGTRRTEAPIPQALKPKIEMK